MTMETVLGWLAGCALIVIASVPAFLKRRQAHREIDRARTHYRRIE